MTLDRIYSRRTNDGTWAFVEILEDGRHKLVFESRAIGSKRAELEFARFVKRSETR